MVKLCRELGKSPREIRAENAQDLRLVLGVIAGEQAAIQWQNRHKGRK